MLLLQLQVHLALGHQEELARQLSRVEKGEAFHLRLAEEVLAEVLAQREVALLPEARPFEVEVLECFVAEVVWLELVGGLSPAARECFVAMGVSSEGLLELVRGELPTLAMEPKADRRVVELMPQKDLRPLVA